MFQNRKVRKYKFIYEYNINRARRNKKNKSRI